MMAGPCISTAAQTASRAVTAILFHHPQTHHRRFAAFAPQGKSPSTQIKAKTNTLFSPLSLLNLFRSLNFFASASAADGFEDVESEEEEEEEEDEEEEEEDEDIVAETSRLYVGNLPYTMTPSQIKEVFTEAGRVASVEVVYDRVTDRSRGFAFVTMGSTEQANEAIRLFDGSQIGGRTVKVNFPEVPRGGEREMMGPNIRSSYQPAFVDTPYKIYSGNLGWGLTSQGLRDAFADQPGVLSAKVIYDRSSGRSRGFGFISFSSAEEAQTALDAMNEVELEGRPLRLSFAAERATPTAPKTQERQTG